MIIDSKEKLEKYIALVSNATSEIYDSMIPHLENAEGWLKNSILGDPLSLRLDELPVEILTTMEKIVSLKAFIESLPFLDVVLTPSGFGIVSTNNLAPASKERVESVRKEATRMLDDALDEVILSLNKSSLRAVWAKGDPYPELTSSLIWRGLELRNFGGMPDAYRTDYLRLKPEIGAAEEQIREVISTEYLDELIGKRQKNGLTELDRKVIHHLWQVVGFYLRGLTHTAETLLNRLVSLMETQPQKFPTYTESSVCKAKQTPIYKNSKHDTTFFFG